MPKKFRTRIVDMYNILLLGASDAGLSDDEVVRQAFLVAPKTPYDTFEIKKVDNDLLVTWTPRLPDGSKLQDFKKGELLECKVCDPPHYSDNLSQTFEQQFGFTFYDGRYKIILFLCPNCHGVFDKGYNYFDLDGLFKHFIHKYGDIWGKVKEEVVGDWRIVKSVSWVHYKYFVLILKALLCKDWSFTLDLDKKTLIIDNNGCDTLPISFPLPIKISFDFFQEKLGSLFLGFELVTDYLPLNPTPQPFSEDEMTHILKEYGIAKFKYHYSGAIGLSPNFKDFLLLKEKLSALWYKISMDKSMDTKMINDTLRHLNWINKSIPYIAIEKDKVRILHTHEHFGHPKVLFNGAYFNLSDADAVELSSSLNTRNFPWSFNVMTPRDKVDDYIVKRQDDDIIVYPKNMDKNRKCYSCKQETLIEELRLGKINGLEYQDDPRLICEKCLKIQYQSARCRRCGKKFSRELLFKTHPILYCDNCRPLGIERIEEYLDENPPKS